MNSPKETLIDDSETVEDGGDRDVRSSVHPVGELLELVDNQSRTLASHSKDVISCSCHELLKTGFDSDLTQPTGGARA